MQIREATRAAGQVIGRAIPEPVKRVMRAGKQLSTDPRLPWWLRVLWVVGCIQIPCLPTDEIALAAAALITFTFYRAVLVDALATAFGR